MGLSVSAAAAILFIAFVIMFGVVFQAIDGAQSEYAHAVDSNYGMMAGKKDTSLSITTVDAANGTLTIQNTGSIVLDPSTIDVMVNGIVVDRNTTQSEVNGHAGSQIWAPQEYLIVHTSCALDGARIKVVAGNGIAAYYG